MTYVFMYFLKILDNMTFSVQFRNRVVSTPPKEASYNVDNSEYRNPKKLKKLSFFQNLFKPIEKETSYISHPIKIEKPAPQNIEQNYNNLVLLEKLYKTLSAFKSDLSDLKCELRHPCNILEYYPEKRNKNIKRFYKIKKNTSIPDEKKLIILSNIMQRIKNQRMYIENAEREEKYISDLIENLNTYIFEIEQKINIILRDQAQTYYQRAKFFNHN